MEVLLSIIGLIVLIIAVRALLVFAQRPRYRKYWYDLSQQPKPDDVFHLLVLGDSIMQGIGASKPMNGLTGLVATEISRQTGYEVYVDNISVTGAKVADVAKHQLPKARIDEADLILVTVSANDAVRRTPVADYAKSMQKLADELPANRTIFADVPRVGMYAKYQKAFDRIMKPAGFRRANFYDANSTDGGFGVVAGDFFHPNNRGHRMWFAAFKPQVDDFLTAHKLNQSTK